MTLSPHGWNRCDSTPGHLTRVPDLETNASIIIATVVVNVNGGPKPRRQEGLLKIAAPEVRNLDEHIRSDNGPEFTARAVRTWPEHLGVKTLFIEPGRQGAN